MFANTKNNKKFIHLGYLVFFVIVTIAGVSSLADIEVIWPKKYAAIGAVDSTFIFGSVPIGSELTINGTPVEVHAEGGFLAFLPIQPGDFVFELRSIIDNDTIVKIWPVKVPRSKQSLPYDTLQIVERKKYSGNLVLSKGDELIVSFQGTPGCVASFSIPGLVDSQPMAEIPPQTQPYWGDAVFGAGATPDSLKIAGYYKGYVNIDDSSIPDSSLIYYYLQAPGISDLIEYIKSNSGESINYDILELLKLNEQSTIDSSSFYVTANPVDFPCLIEFTDSVQIMRVGPRKGYLSIFQPRGVKALAVGREGDWVRLKLSTTQIGWVNVNSIKFLDPALPVISSHVRAIRSESSDEEIIFEIALSDKHPFRVEESEKSLDLYLYGVTSDTDWIRYDFAEKNIKLVTWSQPEPGLYNIHFEFNYPIWGYDTYYNGNILKLQLSKPPQDIIRLKNKVIVVDPGHSGDPGAIGPTGFKESEANLKIALELKKILERKGAQVIMTRDDMSHVPLYDRPEIAVSNNADMFISIHNNALPDGVNPFTNNGISTYYYHPHSIELARCVQEAMLKNTRLPDFGLYYGNLAVSRPTQYPAILVECAFMMIPEQEAMLRGDKFPKKIAKAIGKGIEKFLKSYSSEK